MSPCSFQFYFFDIKLNFFYFLGLSDNDIVKSKIMNTNPCPIPQEHKYLKHIEDLVKKAQHSNLVNKYAACIIRGKKIYSLGFNHTTIRKPVSVHAEISTLHNLDKSIVEISKKQKSLNAN